jgi:hypothetical protein
MEFNSYLYIKDAKSYFDEPREKLSPRSLCGRGTTIARSLKDFVAKVYTTFCMHPELKKYLSVVLSVNVKF